MGFEMPDDMVSEYGELTKERKAKVLGLNAAALYDIEVPAEAFQPEREGPVQLRLPTFWCAPNFAFLMAADTQAAVSEVPGVTAVRVRLHDHFASAEIDAGLAGGRGFDDTFGDDADGGGLAELRALFDRKAFLARQQRLCEALLADGRSPTELARLTLADVPPSEEARQYLARRANLGLDGSPGARFVVTPAGDPVDAERMAHQLRIGRSVRVSIDGNAGLCRGLLATRYGSESS